MCFDPGEDGGQKNGHEREKCRYGCQFGKSTECSWERAEPRNEGCNDRKDNGTLAVISDGIQVLGGHQYMQTLLVSVGKLAGRVSSDLNEAIVEKKHDGSCIPRPSLAPEQHLPNVTYISHLCDWY